MNDYTTKFTLFDEHELREKIGNDQLVGGTKLGIMARMFTANGFRDTQPIFLDFSDSPKTAETKEAIIPPILVVLIVISSLVLMSLLVLLACVCSSRKKKQRLKREKEAAEADENLLSFTSYCVIDKNPLPRKKYND